MVLQKEQCREEYRWLAALFAMTVVSMAVAIWTGVLIGLPTVDILFGYTGILWVLIPPVVLIAMVPWGIRALVFRVEKPWSEFKPMLTERFGTPGSMAGTLGPILMLPMLMGSFGCLKQIMPLIRPFSWDDRFAQLDRLIFFGVQPWQWTHAIFGSPRATMIVDRLYSGWVALLFIAVLGVAMLAPRYLRARFFLSFGLSWLVIGIAGAFAFSSAGPCYTQAIGALAAADYAPLMERLGAIHSSGTALNAVNWQEHLWEAHTSRQYGFAMGVSAMPSMHNAIAFLYVLAVRNASLPSRILAWTFALVILIGSVHLGWHYFVDGVLAWAAMAGLWWVAGAYLRRVGYEERVNKVEPAQIPDLEPAGVPAAA